MSVTAVPLRPIAKGSVAKLWIALALLAALAVGLAWWGTARHRYTRTPSGLQFQVLKEGEGPTPTPQDVAFVTYTGRLPNGKVFDSNVGQQPAPFPVAEGATVNGFSEGLRMMRKGGVYRLRIPPALGYGARDMGQIPPNSTLEFEVAMQGFLPEADLRRMMQQQMMMQQMQQQQQGAAGGPAGAAGPGAAGPGAGAREAPPPQGLPGQ